MVMLCLYIPGYNGYLPGSSILLISLSSSFSSSLISSFNKIYSSSLYTSQLFNNIIYLKVSLDILFLSLVVIRLPILKKDSEGAEVAGIANIFLATLDNVTG